MEVKMERVTHAMRRQKWALIIQECNESGMKKKDWLAEHHINPKQFYRWQKTLRMELGTELILSERKYPEFEVVEPHSQKGKSIMASAVIHKGNMMIELDEDITDLFLLRIIKAAENA